MEAKKHLMSHASWDEVSMVAQQIPELKLMWRVWIVGVWHESTSKISSSEWAFIGKKNYALLMLSA